MPMQTVPACPGLNSFFLSYLLQIQLCPSSYSSFQGRVSSFSFVHTSHPEPPASCLPSVWKIPSVTESCLFCFFLSPCTLFHPLHSRPLLIQFLIISCLGSCSTFHFKFYTTIRVNFLVSHICTSLIIPFMNFRGKFSVLELGRHAHHELCPSTIPNTSPCH